MRLLAWVVTPLLLGAVVVASVVISTNKEDSVDLAVDHDLGFRLEQQPPCWKTDGHHELGCFHPDPLLLEAYPLTEEMLARSANRYPTSDLSMHRAFQRARDRGVLKVVVLGGSVTYGHQCVTPERKTGNECAWPYRLQQWFDERVGDFEVEVRYVLTNESDPCPVLPLQTCPRLITSSSFSTKTWVRLDHTEE